MNPNKNYRN